MPGKFYGFDGKNKQPLVRLEKILFVQPYGALTPPPASPSEHLMEETVKQFEIIYRRTAELRENPDNAKIHPAKQVAKIKRSIKQFGFLSPLIIDQENIVLCGNGRLAAARELGLEAVPTLCAGHLDEARRRALALADNKSADGGRYDEERIAIEIQTILNLEADFEIIDTGFEIGEIDHLLSTKPVAGNEQIDEPAFDAGRVDSICRPGDLWLLGRHRLFCGSALEPASYQVLLGRERADMVFTDPPYNIRIPGVVSGLGKAKHADFVQASGEMNRAQFASFLKTALGCMKGASANGSLHFVCMDWRQIQLLLEVGDQVYDELKAICVWDKQTGGMGSLYRNQHEFIGVFKAGTASHTNNINLGVHGRNRTNIWSYPGMSGFARGRDELLRLHPTVKNLDLVADAIMDCSDIGSLVLDPFAGSGTTAIAAERTRRRAALIELDPKYCDVILRRFCDATGIEPVNAWTGNLVRCKPMQGKDAADGE